MKRRAGTEAPDDLTPEQWHSLSRWASEKENWAIHELERLVEQCLDHHRARGNLMADWVAACRTWIRNERDWRRRTNGGAPGQVPAGRGAERGLAAAAKAAARNLGLFQDN